MRKNTDEKKVDESHEIRELRQINLLMKKLLEKKEEAEQNKKSNDVLHKIKELEQLNFITKKLIDKLVSKRNTNLSEEFLIKLHHELRTPLVPIKGYTDMLLGEHFGKITEEQRKRLEAIKSSVTQLHEALFDMLDNIDVE